MKAGDRKATTNHPARMDNLDGFPKARERVDETALPKGKGCERGGRGSRGQSTVEYMLVLIAFLTMVLSLAAVWRAGRDGALLNRAVSASSHQVGGRDPVGSMQDIALF